MGALPLLRPHWLIEDPDKWPVSTRESTNQTGIELSQFVKKSVTPNLAHTRLFRTDCVVRTLSVEEFNGLISRCGNLGKLIRSTACV